jgi:hypothetical protein
MLLLGFWVAGVWVLEAKPTWTLTLMLTEIELGGTSTVKSTTNLLKLVLEEARRTIVLIEVGVAWVPVVEIALTLRRNIAPSNPRGVHLHLHPDRWLQEL